MEKSKVISVRVPENILAELENVTKNSVYNTKSDFINAGIRLVLAARKEGKGREVLRFHPEFGDVVDEFAFKYHREVKL